MSPFRTVCVLTLLAAGTTGPALSGQAIVSGQGISFVVPLDAPAESAGVPAVRVRRPRAPAPVSRRTELRLKKLVTVRRLLAKAIRARHQARDLKAPRRKALRLGTAKRYAERAARVLVRLQRRFRKDLTFQKRARGLAADIRRGLDSVRADMRAK